MNCVIYIRHGMPVTIYEQFNECARYAKKYGYSIEHKIFDIRGDRLSEAIDKCVFNDKVNSVIVYDTKYIGNFEDYLFYRIYLNKFGKKLLSCN